MIKVLGEGEKAADHPITEADKGTVTIRDTLAKLDQQVEAIENQIERYVTFFFYFYILIITTTFPSAVRNS